MNFVNGSKSATPSPPCCKQQRSLQINIEVATCDVSSGPVILFKPSFAVWTALSAKPFDEGWYGAVVKCLMPFRHDAMNSSNSFDMNAGPLSDPRVSGNPCVSKVTHNFSMAADDVVDGTMCTSIYFEYASTMMSSVLPKIDPA